MQGLAYIPYRLGAYRQEINGRKLQNLYGSLGMMLVEPFLERRPLAALRRGIKPAAERVERKLTRPSLAMLAPEKGNDSRGVSNREAINPPIHDVIRDSPLRTFRSPWPCAGVEDYLIVGKEDLPAPQSEWLHRRPSGPCDPSGNKPSHRTALERAESSAGLDPYPQHC